jgi:hypothetical protein
VDREQREYTALREMGINVDDSLPLTKFRNKIRDEKYNKRKNSSSPTEHSSKDSSSSKRQQFPCCICEAKDHKTHECPRMPEVRICLGLANRADRKKSAWGQDETFDDEDA